MMTSLGEKVSKMQSLTMVLNDADEAGFRISYYLDTFDGVYLYQVEHNGSIVERSENFNDVIDYLAYELTDVQTF